MSGDLPQIGINNLFVYPNSMDSILFIATDAGVYFTDNSGINWVRVGGNMPLIPVFDIDVDMVNNKLIAGTFARSIQSFPIDSIVSSNVITSNQINNDPLQAVTVYPNPSKDYLYIGNLSEKTEIIIYNVIGEVVKQKITDQNNKKINISDLKQGSYFIKINTAFNSKTFKIIKHEN